MRVSLSPRAILVVGWAGFLLYAWPGAINAESADELVDSRVGVFTDWHSPVMSEVWRIVGLFVSGPPGMLMVQSLLLLGGAFLILRRITNERHAAIAAVCVICFPPIAATTAVVWHESQLAGFFIAGVAGLLDERAWARRLGLVCIGLGIGMCDGAAIAALPLVAVLMPWPRHRLAAALVAWAGLFGVLALAERELPVERTDRKDAQLAIFDLKGAAKFEEIRMPKDLDVPDTLDGAELLEQARHDLIFDHTGAYLRHRGHVAWRLLGFHRTRAWRPAMSRFTDRPADSVATRFAAHHSRLQKLLEWPVRIGRDTPLFWPIVYLALAPIGLVYAIVRRQRVAIALLASGLASELALVFLARGAEFRFSHWLIVTTVLAGVWLVFSRTRSASPAPPM